MAWKFGLGPTGLKTEELGDWLTSQVPGVPEVVVMTPPRLAEGSGGIPKSAAAGFGTTAAAIAVGVGADTAVAVGPGVAVTLITTGVGLVLSQLGFSICLRKRTN